MPPQKCCYCKRLFETTRSLKLHLLRSTKGCKRLWQKDVHREPPYLSGISPGDALPDTVPLAEQDDWPQPEPAPISDRSQSPERISERPAKRPCLNTQTIDSGNVPGRYVEFYPGKAAESLGTAKTAFQERFERQQALGLPLWAPFADMKEWELAEWLVNSVNKRKAEQFLKLSVSVKALNLCAFA
jgi:hypothetical protein